jgi:hypothetical protein
MGLECEQMLAGGGKGSHLNGLLPKSYSGCQAGTGDLYLAPQKMVTTGSIDVIYDYMQGVGYQRLLGTEPLERGKGYWILFSNTSEGAEFTASSSVSE